MARPRNPDQAAAFAQLREQYPTGALLKVYRTHPDGRMPEWIANPQGGTFHPASWDDVSQLESWLLAHPQCGPGTYKVQVFTQDDNGKPSKSAAFTFTPPMIQSPAAIAAAQLPTRLAEAQAATQLHTTAIAAEAERLHVALVAEAPKVAAEMEHAMSSPDPAVQAAAMAQAANFQAQLKASADNLAASMQALAASTRGVQALGGATPVPPPGVPPPPGVYAGGYIPPPGMQMVGGPGMMPGMGAPGGMGAATPTPMGLFVPGYGVIPWAALQGGSAGAGLGGFGVPAAPAARVPDPAIAALEARLAEAEKRAVAAEQKAALEAERARHDAAIAQQQRQNDERLAQAQRDQQAALDRQATELRGQIAAMQAQAQAAQTLQQQLAARPPDNTMSMMMPLFQQMQAQAQAAQQQMLAVLANTKNDDASIQVRQAAGAMGEVIQTSMQAVSQMMRMQVAPQGSAQPAWLSMAMRAIDTIGGMGATMLSPAPPQQVVVQQVPQGYGPPPAQLPPAQVAAPQGVPPPAVPGTNVALPPGAPTPQPPGGAPTAPVQQGETVSANPEVVQAIEQARADLAAQRFTSGIVALQRAYDLDAELVRVGESYVTATERLLVGHVPREILDQLKLNVGKYPGMSDVRQPGQPWPAGEPASSPPTTPTNVIPLNPTAPVQA